LFDVYLWSLRIENFRRLQQAELTFQPGLNVIVGENNSGKTAIIEALRSVLGDRRLDVEDLRLDKMTGTLAVSVSVEAIFDGLDVDDAAAFNRALIRGETAGKYRARLAVSASLRGDEIVPSFEAGRGPNVGFFHDVLNARRVHFLPALRDPDSSIGLRPGRQSRQAALLRRISEKADEKQMIDIATRANKDLKATPAVDRATNIVRSNLKLLTSPVYAQDADLSFVDPEFNRLVAQVEGRADGMPAVLNGLGYGNIYYIAAVLGDFEEDGGNPKRYRALMIEEPEAHLHPHHQILLLRFLQERGRRTERPIQIFVTTHSPILASQAAMGGLLPLIDQRIGGEECADALAGRVVTKAAPVEIGQTSEAATRVTQYLDATRSELFFARRLILVEGDAERILGPVLMKRWCDLFPEECAVTIVSAAGLNFAWFLPFISSQVLNVPVAIVTDGDPPARQIAGEELEHSGYVNKLRGLVESDPQIRVFPSKVTFEHDLAREPENAEPLMKAMERIRPKKADAFRKEFGGLKGEAFAGKFYEEFFGTGRTSKAEFAMELSLMLKDDATIHFVIPPYLSEAFQHVLTDLVPRRIPPTKNG
jgi:putative ATP-dependent endonuclease of OLD family